MKHRSSLSSGALLCGSLWLVILLTGCQGQDGSAISSGHSLAGTSDGGPAVMVYYFHRTTRCYSCKTIEARASKAIEKEFATQLTEGRLVWMLINLDEPGGERFSSEFGVAGSTLVVARMKGGTCTEYKKLEKVWQLLGDSRAFREYVTSEVRQYL